MAQFSIDKYTNPRKLQKLVYQDIRTIFELKSQMACNVCNVVAGNYATQSTKGINTKIFYKKSKLIYSYNRDFSFLKNGLLSIGTLRNRIKVPYTNQGLEKYFDGTWRIGASELIYKKGKFFLNISLKKKFAEVTPIQNIVGVDFGMRFLVTAVDNYENHLFVNGSQVKNVRARHSKLRQELQKKNTKSAKRKLRKLSGKENRYMTDVNHCVSKALLHFAGEHSLIIIEDLKGINISTRVKKENRYYRFSWAFYQLRQFIEYKAKINNIKVIAADPRYTSQKCPSCQYVYKNNRNKSKHIFLCQSCGYQSNDDRVAAMNLLNMGIEYHEKIAT